MPLKLAELERRIRRLADDNALPHSWIRDFVAHQVLASMLERSLDSGGKPSLLVKGGVAMQLRFGTRARLTSDFDAVFRGEEQALSTALAEALAALGPRRQSDATCA